MRIHVFRSPDIAPSGTPAPAPTPTPVATPAPATSASPSGGNPTPGSSSPPGTPSSTATPAGGAASPAASDVSVETPTPKPHENPLPFRSAIETIFSTPGEVPVPKEWSPEAYQNYQRQNAQRERYLQFQDSLRKVVSEPVTVADGYTYLFASPDEVKGFGDFVKGKLNGGFTAEDIHLLYRAKSIIRDAEAKGARNYERGIKSRQTPAPQQQQQGGVVVPVPENKSGPNRIPSTKEIMMTKYPDEYNAMMKNAVKP